MRKNGSSWEVARAWADGELGPTNASHFYADGDTIYSYGRHFPMAVRVDEAKLFIVNGDRYSPTTSQHQATTRSAVAGRRGYRSVTVPFSAMRQAGISVDAWDNVGGIRKLRIVDVQEDVNEYRCANCGFVVGTDAGGYNEQQAHESQTGHDVAYFHKLGGSVVRVGRRYFLSGFDIETRSSRSDGYFISELPRPVKTVAEGFDSLAPNEVIGARDNGLEVKRQGDIFAVPSVMTTRKLRRVPGKPTLEVPIHKMARLLETNHVVTEAVVGRMGHVYARGTLYHRPYGRDADHKRITLGTQWHLIYRNRAKQSWSIGGRVD